MYHGSEEEFEGTVAERDGATLFDFEESVGVVDMVEIAHHGDGLGVTDDFDVGVCSDDFGDGSGVVGLHVVDYEVVDISVGGNFMDVVEELANVIDTYGVDEGEGFGTGYDVRVIADAVAEGPETFEERGNAVVYADV